MNPNLRKSLIINGAVWRFMGSLLSIFRMHWDHEPGRRNGARLCEPQHVALQTKLLRVTDPRSEIRFMERENRPPTRLNAATAVNW